MWRDTSLACHVLQDMVAAVEKLNASFAMKEKLQGSYFFGQEEIASLGLGLYKNISLLFFG